MERSRTLECFGGPLCGSKVPDTHQLWLCIARHSDMQEQYFYKRVKMLDLMRGKSLMVWHYHGRDPEKPGVPMIRPAMRKFR